MNNHFLVLLIIICPLLVLSQAVEVDGHLKVMEMDTINTENNLVVKRADGTLATRMVNSLPTTVDTTRSLQSDLLLTSALCNCSNLPPAMIQSLLDNGYSNSDLVDFNISTADLLAAGLAVPDLLAAGVSVQELLNEGITPIALYNSGVVLDTLYGKTYQEGLIAYLNTTTGSGLVAAPIDQSSATDWGCANFFIGGTMSNIGTGQMNTDIVINCGGPDIAARLCDDLVIGIYDDWFLPSIDELNELYINLEVNGLGGFDSSSISNYWSSTESTFEFALIIDFADGNQLDLNKTSPVSVRAVRDF